MLNFYNYLNIDLYLPTVFDRYLTEDIDQYVRESQQSVFLNFHRVNSEYTKYTYPSLQRFSEL
jgi:hypothetical protein